MLNFFNIVLKICHTSIPKSSLGLIFSSGEHYTVRICNYSTRRYIFTEMIPIRQLQHLKTSPFASLNASASEMTSSMDPESNAEKIENIQNVLEMTENKDDQASMTGSMEIKPLKPKKAKTLINPALLANVTKYVRMHPESASSVKSDGCPQEHGCDSPSPHTMSNKSTHGNQISSQIGHENEQKKHGSTDDISDLFSNASRKADDKSLTKHKKRKRKKGNSSSAGKTDDGSAQKKRPNYFVAIQVTNPQIHRRLEMVQKHVLSQDARLSAAMIPLPTLHITVLVTHLADQEHIDKAQSALKECRQKLDDLCTDPLVLHVKGVDNFRHNVVFANIEEGPAKQRLSSVADVVADCFESAELTTSDDFKPHLTIMKLSKAVRLRKKGIKKIDPSLYDEVLRDEFGLQTVRGLQLCAMMKPKDRHGYYHTVCEEKLVPEDYRELDLHQGVIDESCDSEISRASQELASDIIARAMETIRDEQLQNSRKRKLQDKNQGGAKRRAVDGTLRPAKVDLVELQRQLVWEFKAGQPPDLDSVIAAMKKHDNK